MTDTNIRQASETKDLHKFLLLKTEKLSVAVHILTGHLSVSEPLRSEIRQKSLRLASDTQVIVADDHEALSDTQHLARGVDAVLSLIYVLKGARLVSPGNAHILEREYLEMKNHFESMTIQKQLESGLETGENNMQRDHNTAAIRQSMGHEIIHQKVSESGLTAKKVRDPSASLDSSSRRELILNIIEGRNSYSLGEVAMRIKGVSEKTIQRDLLSLVASKILKKVGERRWSRYSRA